MLLEEKLGANAYFEFASENGSTIEGIVSLASKLGLFGGNGGPKNSGSGSSSSSGSDTATQKGRTVRMPGGADAVMSDDERKRRGLSF
jgi:hypothetical protein